MANVMNFRSIRLSFTAWLGEMGLFRHWSLGWLVDELGSVKFGWEAHDVYFASRLFVHFKLINLFFLKKVINFTWHKMLHITSTFTLLTIVFPF